MFPSRNPPKHLRNIWRRQKRRFRRKSWKIWNWSNTPVPFFAVCPGQYTAEFAIPSFSTVPAAGVVPLDLLFSYFYPYRRRSCTSLFTLSSFLTVLATGKYRRISDSFLFNRTVTRNLPLVLQSLLFQPYRHQESTAEFAIPSFSTVPMPEIYCFIYAFLISIRTGDGNLPPNLHFLLF